MTENRSQLDPKDPSRYICGCRVHVHQGKGEKIHRHPCAEHPRLHDHVPAPLARDHTHE